MAPWNTTRAYIQAAKGKCLLVLVGTELWYPPQEGLASHVEIIYALERRDEEASVAAMKKHLEENLTHLNEFLHTDQSVA